MPQVIIPKTNSWLSSLIYPVFASQGKIFNGMIQIEVFLKDRKLLSDEKRIASGIIGRQENKMQDVV